MLLAPTNAKSWAPRVKWIIFDEIHSISQAQDGVVWEQLLLLAPCPIIALSATVGNPTEFCDWLTETQKALGQKLTMIQHSTRYSDLGLSQYDINEEVIEVIGTGDAAEHDADEELANETVTLTTTDLFEPDPTGKKKVVDNWDDEEDEIAAREMMAEENKLEKANTYDWEYDDLEYNDLKNVHRAFCMVKAEFDAKFKASVRCHTGLQTSQRCASIAFCGPIVFCIPIAFWFRFG